MLATAGTSLALRLWQRRWACPQFAEKRISASPQDSWRSAPLSHRSRSGVRVLGRAHPECGPNTSLAHGLGVASYGAGLYVLALGAVAVIVGGGREFLRWRRGPARIERRGTVRA
jgi:hypothetical protein